MQHSEDLVELATPLGGKGLKDDSNIFCHKKIACLLINKNIENNIANYYENIDFHRPYVVKKNIIFLVWVSSTTLVVFFSFGYPRLLY